MIGIVPAAGTATRMQPLGGAKELLMLGSAPSPPGGPARLRAVGEYLIERILLAGADRICIVTSAEKPDLLRFFAQADYADRVFFVVQPRPAGLCDAIFRARRFVEPGEAVLIGLPDTVWFPATALRDGLRAHVHLITFPAAHPEAYDAVVPGFGERVARVEVKSCRDPRRRIWGAITAPGHEYLALERFWRVRGRGEQFLGDLLNAWIAAGNPVTYDCQGTRYWDIGTPAGYEYALRERVWEAA
ncbi:MAG TPA: hypothetical protein VN515_09140 [Terriglobales bacterium]|nr:hypothetical protein [Terriglobales bacterium]